MKEVEVVDITADRTAAARLLCKKAASRAASFFICHSLIFGEIVFLRPQRKFHLQP